MDACQSMKFPRKKHLPTWYIVLFMMNYVLTEILHLIFPALWLHGWNLKQTKSLWRISRRTLCVGTILGTTFTGEIDPIKEINELLVNIKKTDGWDIPIHVDAASCGFVIPFANPELEWDFRLSNVKSINVSSHKYGLVYPSMDGLFSAKRATFPKTLCFTWIILGNETPTYSLNFSASSSMMLAQYYNLLRFFLSLRSNWSNL